MKSTLLFPLILLIALVALWVFYDKFTKRGAIPLDKAARDFTTWLGLAGLAFSDWIVALLQWVAGFWDQMQVTIGPALSAPGLDKFIMAWSALMLALKFKAQWPRLQVPTVPPASPDARSS